MNETEVRHTAERIEALVQQVESWPETEARGLVTELLQALLTLYGSGLERVLEILGHHDGHVIDRLVDDELIAHLLCLHGLHPLSLKQRVAAALEHLRAFAEEHGGTIDLLSLTEEEACVRWRGGGPSCPSTSGILVRTLDRAIRRAAPELQAVRVEGAADPVPNGLITVDDLRSGHRHSMGTNDEASLSRGKEA